MAKNDDRKVKRGVYLYIDGKEINNDITSIQAEIRQLTKDIKDMQIGSEEYTQTVRKIRTLRGILKEHKDTIRQVTDETKKSTISFGRFVDGFNRFGGFIASMVASLTGLILGLRSLRDEKNKLESSQASLKALTGLDDDSISWLTQQAQVLSTTMTKEGLRVKAAADEILDAYMLVGSAKPELLSNKEALAAVTEEAMRMQAAAGDITLAQAVDALTLSLNQYGAEADQAARFTNVLAAGSKEGAANISSQTAAIRNSGVAAASANVSFEETVALIQTLAYSGIKDEVAGTALKKFFLVLQTGADDVNPKIVGLSKALENLKAKNMGAADIKDMFGEEGYNAASVILQNIDMVNRYTEAVTGTSVAQEQAAINSATAEAKLAQVRNEMKLAGIELIEKLNPAIMVSTNAMTYVIKILPGLIDWIKKYKDIIVITAVTLGTYVTTLKLATFWEQKLKGEKLSSIIVDKAKIAWTKALTAAGYLQAAAMFLLTTRFSNLTTSIRLSLAAMKMFFATLNLNPFAVIITSVTALAMGIYKLKSYTSEANKTFRMFSENNLKQQEELRHLYEAIKITNEGSHRRIELINEFNKKYGNYLSNLLSEKASVSEIANAYKEVSAAIQNKLAMEEIDRKRSEITNNSLEDRADAMTAFQRALATGLSANVSDNIRNYIIGYVDKQVKEGYSQKQISDAIYNSLYKKYGKSIDLYNLSEAKDAIRDYVSIVKEDFDRITDIENKFGSLIVKTKENKEALNELPEVIVTPDSSTSTVSGTGSGTDEKNKFAAQEAEYYRQIAEIKKQYLEDSAMTQDEYNNRMLQAELKLLQDKLSIAGLEPEEQQKIMDQVLDARIKLRNAMIEQEKQEADEKKKIQEQAVQDRLDLLDRQQKMETIKLNEQYINGLIGESEYQQNLKNLALGFIEEKLNDASLGEDMKLQLIMSKHEILMAEFRRQKEEEERETKKYMDLITGIASQFGGVLGGIMTKSEDAMKDSLKNMLLIMLDYLEKVMIMAVGKVTILSFTDIISNFTSIAKIMAIKAAFSAVKTAISSGFADGGYTPDGPWDKPQGVVHSGEFVSNRFAVRNKHLRPVFDLIDQAQRAGSVANLTGDDIAAVVSSPVTSSGTTKTRPEPVRKSTVDPELMAAIYGLIKVTGRLNKRLDEPFVTVNSVTGKGGIKEAMDEYDNLNSNKNRSTK